MNNTDAMDPNEALRLAQASETAAQHQFQPPMMSVWLAWAIAWAVAMGTAYLTTRAKGPDGLPIGWAVYGASLALAGVFTGIATGRASRGLSGRGQRAGTVWFATWAISWVAYIVVTGSIRNLIDEANRSAAMNLLMPVLATMLVGLLYQQGGGLWPRLQMTLVGWLLIITASIASLVDAPTHYLVLLFGGVASFGVGAFRCFRGADGIVE